MYSWIEEYTIKFAESDFNEDKINNLLKNVVDSINTAFKDNNIEEKAEFDIDKKVIALPDCFIGYQIIENGLCFNKTDKNNSSKIVNSARVNFCLGYYIIVNKLSRTTGETIKYKEMSFDLIYKVIETLLTK
ncbi:hypothetical protein LGL55_10550 [Clostridium tagluense]|uniref:hypothetical protein n=1 Tax=Clostridium tagluense TaxID=360422 RepID=UPI001CF0D6BE|nr:hypothetical protein [Clostridium tagluense]MCB2311621.1 hypothetical protein [Clostridium tagluense]MCB2316345.1 hypothetical protein [Clostridium tagluense]MCB2321271.1 hypothetical protein [Clostridium tagluense]MCB2326214.1 hypothetical protein [Clostridium tagluense]MCB2331007.1 hypothetical protein [Clostridium tagluense]